jgi:predicted GNAT family acetyltransferase
MTPGYEIALAIPDDISGILALQEPNLPDSGGSLSVRQNADWFKHAMLDMPLIVARSDGQIVGYLVATSLAAKSHIPIIQAMLRSFSTPPDCYLYGPVCVAAAERGKGLAGIMFEALCARLPGRSAMTFIRADNAASRQAHRKMGMRELGPFTHDGATYIALSYSA